VTTKEQLAEIQTDIAWLKKAMANHLAHHWAITLSLVGVTAASVASLLVALLAK
jgi:hypothetical protein